jgi:hypothetical protein
LSARHGSEIHCPDVIGDGVRDSADSGMRPGMSVLLNRRLDKGGIAL